VAFLDCSVNCIYSIEKHISIYQDLFIKTFKDLSHLVSWQDFGGQASRPRPRR